MAFTARLGEAGIPADLSTANLLFASGGSVIEYTGTDTWFPLTVSLDRAAEAVAPTPPASPAPPPPSYDCASSSLAALAGFPCSTQLGNRGFSLYYHLDQ